MVGAPGDSLEVQAHHHGVLALALVGRVVVAAQAHLDEAMALVQGACAHIAGPHLQPQGRIAPQSPLARALLGAALGDTVLWSRPSGKLELEIIAIHYGDAP